MIAGTQRKGFISAHIYHHTGTKADGICGKGGDLVGVGTTIIGGECFIGKFTQEERAIGMSDFTGIHINGQGATGKFKRAYLWANHPHRAILPVAGSA